MEITPDLDVGVYFERIDVDSKKIILYPTFSKGNSITWDDGGISTFDFT